MTLSRRDAASPAGRDPTIAQAYYRGSEQAQGCLEVEPLGVNELVPQPFGAVDFRQDELPVRWPS